MMQIDANQMYRQIDKYRDRQRRITGDSGGGATALAAPVVPLEFRNTSRAPAAPYATAFVSKAL